MKLNFDAVSGCEKAFNFVGPNLQVLLMSVILITVNRRMKANDITP